MLFFKSSDVNSREEVIYILLPFPPEYTRTSYRIGKPTTLNNIGYRFVEYQITRRVPTKINIEDPLIGFIRFKVEILAV
jgi:hypothetical protein